MLRVPQCVTCRWQGQQARAGLEHRPCRPGSTFWASHAGMPVCPAVVTSQYNSHCTVLCCYAKDQTLNMLHLLSSSRIRCKPYLQAAFTHSIWQKLAFMTIAYFLNKLEVRSDGGS